MVSYLKALVGALVAGLGSLYQAFDDDRVTGQEWVAVALATLVALGTIWGVPNLDPRGKRQRDSVQPPDRGEITLVGVLVVVLVVAVIFVVTRAL
jgi:hypothetical protein